MEINEIHSEHEHATTSLKVVLLVFAIVLIGALAYLVWAQNRAVNDTDYSTPSVKNKTEAPAVQSSTTQSGDQKTYINSTYGFSVTYNSRLTFQAEDLHSGELFSALFTKATTNNCAEIGTCDNYYFKVGVYQGTLEAFKKDEKESYENNPDANPMPTYTKTTVAGKSAERSSVYLIAQEGARGERLLIPNGNYLYEIVHGTGGYTDQKHFDDSQAEFELFLSSFKFTN